MIRWLLRFSICHYYTRIEKGKLKYKICTQKKKKKKTPPRSSKNVPTADNCTLLPPLGNVKTCPAPEKLARPRICFVNEAAILRYDRSGDHDERISFPRLNRSGNDHNPVHHPYYYRNNFCSSLMKAGSCGYNYYHFFSSSHQAMKKTGSRNICCLFWARIPGRESKFSEQHSEQ